MIFNEPNLSVKDELSTIELGLWLTIKKKKIRKEIGENQEGVLS